MKRNVLGLAAVVAAVVLSSFTAKVNTFFYYVYSSGQHSQTTSYLAPTTTAQATQAGTTNLAWISLESVNASIDAGEFLAAFEALDITNDASNSLSDDAEGIKLFDFAGTTGLQARLEKKN